MAEAEKEIKNNIVELNVAPKIVKERYRRQQVVLKFDPDRKGWMFVVEYMRPVMHKESKGPYTTIGRARLQAQRTIDQGLDE